MTPLRPGLRRLAAWFLPSLALAILLPLSARADAPGAEDLDLILREVEPFALGSAVPGVLEIDRSSARPLLRNAERKVFAAIGCSDTGRVAAFAHGSFLKRPLLETQAEVLRLVGNTIRWAGRSSRPSVGLTPQLSGLEDLLRAEGMQVRILPPDDLINQVDVYCFTGHEPVTEGGLDNLRRFALKGGGVVTSATPWPFAKKYPDFSTFPGNQIASLAGIEFRPDGYARVTGPAVAPLPSPDGPVEAARKLMEPESRNGAGRAGWITELRRGLELDPEVVAPFLQAIAELDRAIGPLIPTRESPHVPGKDPLADAVIEIRNTFNQTLPADLVPALPAAADYPGPVPEGAPRIAREIRMDGTWKGWLSGRGAGGWAAKEMRGTGLYAAPGEAVRVTVPSPIVDAGFEVVIGAYNGGLKNRDQWHRYPRTQRAFPIRSRETLAANGLGGLITIRVPRDADFGPLDLSIEGAIEAPHYVHGQTSLSDWNNRVRRHPAPWAELESERIIIALPSSHIRDLRNPDEVMEVWNGFIDTAARLVSVDRDDYRQERIVFDRQTAAGSMHSGYPVAAHLGRNAEQAVDASSLRREGNWGFFHEYGHNHQHNLWALPGTGETTCNLWSVYLFEEYVGKPREATHGGVNPLRRRQLRNAYFENGRNFDSEWNVWTALDAYLLIQEAFGWEPFQKVFHEYNTLPEPEWPRTQQEKNDQWVLRLSRACGVNLEPYYAAWNLPLTDAVSKGLAGLPVWKDDPVKRYVD